MSNIVENKNSNEIIYSTALFFCSLPGFDEAFISRNNDLNPSSYEPFIHPKYEDEEQ